MKVYKLKLKDKNDHYSFFNEFSAAGGGFYNTDGRHNLSVDGSGVLPSVNVKEAQGIKRYLLKKFELPPSRKMRVLDVGAGAGYLQAALEKDETFEAYSFEGSSALLPHAICDKSKYVICDLSKKIDDIRLFKAFNLTTSFEVFEHIYRSDLKCFIENLAFLGDYHLCSIHVANEESYTHCTIIPLEQWIEFFSDLNIKSEVLGYYPCSLDTNLEEMRSECSLFHWNCSIFLLLSFKNGNRGKQSG